MFFIYIIYIFRNIVAILQSGVMGGCLTGCLHTLLLHAAFFFCSFVVPPYVMYLASK